MKNKLGNPFFLASVIVLLVNDWYLKAEYGNFLTGKLSDYSGLIAFPFFFSVLFPLYKKPIHIISAILFIYWNSQFSQPIIHLANSFNIPINRTVDITDNLALFSIAISYILLNHKYTIKLKPIIQYCVMLISCFAFMATSIPPREKRVYTEINKTYEFEISKSELLTRFNMIQMRTIDNLNKNSGTIVFDSDRNIFHYNRHTDTLAILYDNADLINSDTLEINTTIASFILSGEQNKSQITLIKVIRIVPQFSEKDFREKAIKHFEKRIIKKLKKY